MLRGTLSTYALLQSRWFYCLFLTICVCFVFATFKGGGNGIRTLCWSFPAGSVIEKRPASAGDPGSIRGSGRFAGEGIGYLLLLGVGDGQGCLACCASWGCKESDIKLMLLNCGIGEDS